MLEFRPHHFLCTLGFEGKGYSDEFVRNYYRYADQAFLSRQNSAPHSPIVAKDFGFELYASGEYSRMLEKAWAEA